MNFVEGNIKHSLKAYYTGNSVIGLKFNNGIIIASDTKINYGSSLEIKDSDEKIKELNERTLIGYSGEVSDFQESSRILEELINTDKLETNYNGVLGPNEIAHYLSSLHYQQRNNLNPFLNSAICGGIDFSGEIVLYNIDSFGTLLESNYFTTSMASYFCPAIFRNDYPKNPNNLTKEQALEILRKCFEVLFYRHDGAGDEIRYMLIEKNNNNIPTIQKGEFKLVTKWDFNEFKVGKEKYYLTQ